MALPQREMVERLTLAAPSGAAGSRKGAVESRTVILACPVVWPGNENGTVARAVFLPA